MSGFQYHDESVSETSSCGLGAESSCFGDDIVMLGEVDWELVRHHQGYTGSVDNEVLVLLTPGILDGVRCGTGTMWVRKLDMPRMATIHRMEPVPKGRIIDLEGKLNTDWIQTCLAQETPEAKDILWNLLKGQYPSLVRGDATSPTAMPGDGAPFPLDMSVMSNGEGVPIPEALQERQYSSAPSFASSMNSQNGSGFLPMQDYQSQGGSEHGGMVPPEPQQQQPCWCCPCGFANAAYVQQCEKCGVWRPDGPPPPQQQGYGGGYSGGSPMYPPTPNTTSPTFGQGGGGYGGGYPSGPSGGGYTTLQLVLPVLRGKIGWVLRNDDLVVTDVTECSPAHAAGVTPGMRIVSLGGHNVLTVDDVRMALQSVGTVFDCVVSTDLSTLPRKPASQLDRPMTTLLQKAPHDKMGTVWVAADNLILKSVDPGTAADMAGCAGFIGWRLTHVNHTPVYTSNDIVREATGQSSLALSWAKSTGHHHPGAPPLLNGVSQSQGQYPHDGMMGGYAGGMMAPHQQGGYPSHAPMHQQQPHQQHQHPHPPQPQPQQQEPVKPTTVFAPSLLWVIAPERVHHCGGLYRLQDHPLNEQPCWQHVVNQLLLYSSAKGLWCVSDSAETGNGWVFSMVPSVYGMPDTVPDWEAMGQHDANIRVVSQLPIPGVLVVNATHPKLEAIRGVYTLVRDQDETGLPFRVVNGMPVWQCEQSGRYLYSSRKGTWFITDDVSDFSRGGGSLCGKTGHGGLMPFEQGVWVTRDNVERPDVRISLPNAATPPGGYPADQASQASGASAPSAAAAPAKTNATASVRENAVWRYNDVGSFSLASYLQRHNAGAHLRWVPQNATHGYLGIDLSNEEHRSQLVRMLTELIDQECIIVSQPLVAGVAVAATERIAAPDGTVIEAGAKGQVVSVTSGRTPVGNMAPRAARVTFVGGHTMSVSYGQVEPVQGAFERGAKVRVLAVDAVALVDSEMAPSGGVGVRGKYRIKYATGKTYHVRNFALITADKPWGEGDEIQETGKYPEGTQVMLAEHVVFPSIDAIPEGTAGVVTSYNGGGMYEVLAHGQLFIAGESQLKAGAVIARGMLVASQLHRGEDAAAHAGGPRWECGRVQAVLTENAAAATPDTECIVLTPSGATVREPMARLKPLHFVTGQGVRVMNRAEGGEPSWAEGTVVCVTATGVPLVHTPGAGGARGFWFVEPTAAAAAAVAVAPVVPAAVGGDAAADKDPLDTMVSYITMDPAMLNEAEVMRREWIEAQHLRGAVQLKKAAMGNATRISRLEAVCNEVLLQKEKDEPMGTVFHDENVLLLQNVAEASAAKRSGVARFLGRTLVAIDGTPVKCTAHVKQAATGKERMRLQFEQAPFCPQGHQLPIIFNPDTSKSGTCPGCFMPFNIAYYACRKCEFAVCGSCGKGSHMAVPPVVQAALEAHAAQIECAPIPSPPPRAATPSPPASSASTASPVRRASEGCTRISPAKVAAAAASHKAKRHSAAPAPMAAKAGTPTASAAASSVLTGPARSGGLFGGFGGSWGSTAFSSTGAGDNAVYSGMSWGSVSVKELADKSKTRTTKTTTTAEEEGKVEDRATAGEAADADDAAGGGKKKENGDIFKSFGSLTNLLNRASELPVSPEDYPVDKPQGEKDEAWSHDAADKRVY